MNTLLSIFAHPYFIVFSYIVAGGFAISGLDDLLFDGLYFKWRINRFFNRKRIRNFTIHSLEPHKEHRIAILVPCWRESSVIGRMVHNAIKTIKYSNYSIILGVYPNDKPTLIAARKLIKRFPEHVKIIVNQKPGPTTKADNLNSTFIALETIEGKNPFSIIITHDSEDVVHPYSLRVFNYLISQRKKHMVQIPVLPLSMPWWELIHWTYADEFSENHLRHMITREHIGAFVPSAGVGTAYDRTSLETLEKHHGRVFNDESLVEDYHSAIELHHTGHGTIFATMFTDRGEIVATRSIFPRHYREAIRQKTRWITGIALQTWQQTGWQGDVKMKYCLFRDRKQVITGSLNLFGYIILIPFFILPFFFEINPIHHIPIILWYLFLFDTLLFLLRIILRMSAVSVFYGFGNSILVPIRYVMGNFINFSASVRAIHHFFFRPNRQSIPWDKTSHEFPTQAMLK